MEDVILARVMAPPEKSKKKNGKTARCESHETLPGMETLMCLVLAKSFVAPQKEFLG